MEKVPVLGWTQSTIDSKDTMLTSGDPLQSGHTQPPPPRHSSAYCQSYPSMFYCCPSRGMYLSPRLLSFLLCTLYSVHNTNRFSHKTWWRALSPSTHIYYLLFISRSCNRAIKCSRNHGIVKNSST